MKKYDGWTLKNCYYKIPFLILGKVKTTRAEVIKELECDFDDHWENIKRRHQLKIVKIKLIEVK